jgi:hypothetical protein
VETTYMDSLQEQTRGSANFPSGIQPSDSAVSMAQDDVFLRYSPGLEISDEEFTSRSLEENRFWLRIMMEHAFFLKISLPGDAMELVNKAKHYEQAFEAQLHRALHETPEDPVSVKQLNEDSIRLLEDAMAFKQEVFYQNARGEYRGFNWTKTAEHIRREPLFVIKLLKRLNSRIDRPLIEEVVEDNECFLKIMAEHGAFMAHFLDPDEDDLIELSRSMATKFKLLTLQARNLEIEPPTKMALLSQLTIFRGSTLLFHGFAEEVHRLTQDGQIRGIVDPNLTGHITREAAKYLKVLEQQEARIKATLPVIH